MVTIPVDLDYKQHPNNYKLAHIPGTKGPPLIGNALPFIKDMLADSRSRVKRFGEVSRFVIADQTGLLVVGADNYKTIMLDRESNFSNEMGYAQQLGAFYRGGLLLLDFDEHRMQRRIMQQAFKFTTMKHYMDPLNERFDHHLVRWPKDTEIKFYYEIKKVLLDIGSRIFLGEDGFNQDAELVNHAFADISGGLGSVLRFNLIGTKFYRGLRGKATLADYVARKIPDRRAGDGEDVLSHMCRERNEHGEFFSDQEIIQHTTFLLFAAHDTTTSVLSHMVMYLGSRPEYQERLRQECLALNTDELDYTDLDKLPEFERCFEEVMRLHPPVPMSMRRTIRETELGGHKIPPNTLLFMPTCYNQRDPQYWTSPDEFDPSRFDEPRNEHKNHSYCYHPFGGGAHKCIGMHFALMLSKCFIFHLLRNYTVATPPGYSPILDWVPIPKPADGVPITLTALEN